jgi:hypothetical protein
MKIILTALFLSVWLAGTARADIFDTLSSADKDKYVHFCAGTVISHGSYPLFKKYLKKKEHAWLYAWGLSVAAGVAKEMSDRKETGFSTSDLAYSVLGGATIVVVKF